MTSSDIKVYRHLLGLIHSASISVKLMALTWLNAIYSTEIEALWFDQEVRIRALFCNICLCFGQFSSLGLL